MKNRTEMTDAELIEELENEKHDVQQWIDYYEDWGMTRRNKTLRLYYEQMESIDDQLKALKETYEPTTET